MMMMTCYLDVDTNAKEKEREYLNSGKVIYHKLPNTLWKIVVITDDESEHVTLYICLNSPDLTAWQLAVYNWFYLKFYLSYKV